MKIAKLIYKEADSGNTIIVSIKDSDLQGITLEQYYELSKPEKNKVLQDIFYNKYLEKKQ